MQSRGKRHEHQESRNQASGSAHGRHSQLEQYATLPSIFPEPRESLEPQEGASHADLTSAQYHEANLEAEADLRRLLSQSREITREGYYSEGISTSKPTPLPPLHPPRRVGSGGESAAPDRGSVLDQSSSRQQQRNVDSLLSVDRLSSLELHHPAPIAPPNHECVWKERYLALTAEIRLLKAEMTSTRRASLRGDSQAWDNSMQESQDEQRGAVMGGGSQEDEFAISGLTIVMHMKGKDDIVINTDLTQDLEEEAAEDSGPVVG
ncbi:hypothetical protein F4780DRAFT_238748 [Xylariomycetidae sp. FL0641]|nr:hypothetical protein F4780DRAFT_238748 [Xylariomycetidae sp. FL0641]